MIPLHGIQVSLDGIDAVFVDLCFKAMRPLAQLAAGSEGAAVRSAGPFSPKELPYLLLHSSLVGHIIVNPTPVQSN